LRAATQNVNPQQQNHIRPVEEAAPQQQAQQQGNRFGLNSLIGRMTGQAGDTPAAAPQTARQQPPVQGGAAQQAPAPAPQAQANPDQDRIEIPAFLRRQAN